LFRALSQVALIALLAAPCARANKLTDIERACFERGNFHKGIHWLEECIQEMFTAEDFHVTMTSVAPGAGIVAFGPGYSKEEYHFHTQFIVETSAAVSTDASYVGAAQITFAIPSLSLGQKGIYDKPSSREKFGIPKVERPIGEEPLDAKASLSFGYRRFDAREQDFYGLGPNSSLSGNATYGLLQSSTYAKIDNPLTTWNSIGFNLSFLQPRVTSSINGAVPQIRAAYNATTAPGLNSRDDFMRYEPYILFRIPPRRSLFDTLRVGYAAYQALGDSTFSFQRLTATSTTFIPLWIPSHHTPDNRRPKIKNYVCPSLRSATRCSMGDLRLIGTYAASYKGAHSQVPFYFDQTLGGTNIDGTDTLRGYVDYRFRAPSSILFQIEYRRPIWGPFGFLAFYDLGKVALIPSDLSLDHLRHDIGVGLWLRAGNREVVRLYFGFGTGEGSRLQPKFPVSF